MRKLVMMAMMMAVPAGAARAADLAQRLAADPDGVVEEVAVLIAGHGAAAGINRAGILQSVALDRARARAREAARLLAADLDGDGRVTQAEVAVLGQAVSASTRGRLLLAFAKADGDGDGTLNAAEVRAHGEQAAARSVPVAEEGRRLALLTLDGNRDGWLTLAEVRAAADKADPGT